ncbi:unnamed protein product [Prorocentrum cordatum]|uniref:Uncharacterized protein n=1 Tax=Prorocentrum cordatum TaxID=2364126 RepID=A0ABN9Q5I1_9DINO|nr:unnamed protein product [Polarella glacialis]
MEDMPLPKAPMEDAPTSPSELNLPFVNIPKIQGSLPPPMPDGPSIMTDFEIPSEGTASKVPAVDVCAAWAGKEKHAVNDAEVKEECLSDTKKEWALGDASTAQDEANCDVSKAGSTPEYTSSTYDVENPHAAREQEEVALRDASKQSDHAGDASKASSKEYRISRKPWRLISNRRRTTKKWHHGKTSLHKAAWYAECITCGLFSVACLVMLCLWARHVNEESFVNTFFVTAIAAMTYFAKSCHMGDMVIKGDLVPIARYVDWITTTPLMLYELCHIAHATTPMIIMVIMSDLLMLATGIIAALMPWKPYKHLKHVWFGFSCFFYIMLLVSLQVDVGYKASKQIEVAANLFKQLEMLTIVVWSFYPIIVGIGRAHLGLITKPTEDICLCILDVVAKIGMEGIIVGSCFNGCVEAGAH